MTAGYGPDVSEHNATFPDGDFVLAIVRVLNENGREDHRWRGHVAAGRARGLALGAYAIILPGNPAGVGATEFGHRYADLLDAAGDAFTLVPTVDIELGDPAACEEYARAVNSVLRKRGHDTLMGYYSAGSAYRQRCAYLYERQWLASWGSGPPAGSSLHQFTNRPYDNNWTPDVEHLRAAGPIPPPPIPPEGELDVWICSTKDNPEQCFVFVGGASSTCTEEFKLAAHEQGIATFNDIHPLQVIRWRLDFPPAGGYSPRDLEALNG